MQLTPAKDLVVPFHCVNHLISLSTCLLVQEKGNVYWWYYLDFYIFVGSAAIWKKALLMYTILMIDLISNKHLFIIHSVPRLM